MNIEHTWTEEQKLRMALAWLDDQIGMTSPETPRATMYLIIRSYIADTLAKFQKEDEGNS